MKVEDYEALKKLYDQFQKSSRGDKRLVIKLYYNDGKPATYTNILLTEPFFKDNLLTIDSLLADDNTPLDEWFEKEIKAAKEDDVKMIQWAGDAVNKWVARILTLPGAEIFTCITDKPIQVCEQKGCHLLWFESAVRLDTCDDENSSHNRVLQPFDLSYYRSAAFHGAGIAIPMSLPVGYLQPTPDEIEVMEDFAVFYSIRECQRVTRYDLVYCTR